MRFEVTARDSAGVQQTFSREAETQDELLHRLRGEKLLVLDVREAAAVRELPPLWHPAWLRPVSGFDVEMGIRQLASMLRSGVTLLKALATVQEQAIAPRAKRMWQRVKEAVFRGGAFAAALADQPKRFSEIVVRLAEVGEKSGELEHALTRAADQMEARRRDIARFFYPDDREKLYRLMERASGDRLNGARAVLRVPLRSNAPWQAPRK